MNVGYIRVSTNHQNTTAQELALKERQCEKIFIDKGKSGKNTDRDALKECLQFLREGDTLICYTLSRLGRSLSDLINIVNDLQNRDVNIEFIAENIKLDKSPHNQLIFHIFSCLAQYEREQKLELINAGLAAAKEKGIALGRPKKFDNEKDKLFKELCQKVDNGELRPCDVYHDKRLNISKASYYRMKKEL